MEALLKNHVDDLVSSDFFILLFSGYGADFARFFAHCEKWLGQLRRQSNGQRMPPGLDSSRKCRDAALEAVRTARFAEADASMAQGEIIVSDEKILTSPEYQAGK
jgi:hypothetical protein